MGDFKFTKTEIPGLRIIEPRIFGDDRGYFMETYNYKDFKTAGIDNIFVQDNQSKSVKGVLRGLHYQNSHPQAKLVRVISGAVFDVAVDIRENTPAYKKWFGILLSAENRKQLFIPEGFAHGFLVVSDEAEFFYKCSDYYYPEDERGILWNHPEIGIKWPLEDIGRVIVSLKDSSLGFGISDM